MAAGRDSRICLDGHWQQEAGGATRVALLRSPLTLLTPFLDQQIDFIKPRIVLAVGRIAAHTLLGSDAPLGRLRGREHFLKDGTLPLVVTYHPAYLLRSPSQKRKAWQDLCMARELLDRFDK